MMTIGHLNNPCPIKAVDKLFPKRAALKPNITLGEPHKQKAKMFIIKVLI